METAVDYTYHSYKGRLETFLVEWKPGKRLAIVDSGPNLETFLVEWKPILLSPLPGSAPP